ncbi:hypothetical protein SCHPADRAFT_897371 [Schizopora paradoxa]|uniref:Uncharacterized protein n=1 Tax=Schizopora paradoxa TaxID=27342 RepID=A0A0H2QXE1_9AGAM|nr:hypothetical protein SCHPADRAFT_897371 [Schizopora paradoxa]
MALEPEKVARGVTFRVMSAVLWPLVHHNRLVLSKDNGSRQCSPFATMSNNAATLRTFITERLTPEYEEPGTYNYNNAVWFEEGETPEDDFRDDMDLESVSCHWLDELERLEVPLVDGDLGPLMDHDIESSETHLLDLQCDFTDINDLYFPAVDDQISSTQPSHGHFSPSTKKSLPESPASALLADHQNNSIARTPSPFAYDYDPPILMDFDEGVEPAVGHLGYLDSSSYASSEAEALSPKPGSEDEASHEDESHLDGEQHADAQGVYWIKTENQQSAQLDWVRVKRCETCNDEVNLGCSDSLHAFNHHFNSARCRSLASVK